MATARDRDQAATDPPSLGLNERNLNQLLDPAPPLEVKTGRGAGDVETAIAALPPPPPSARDRGVDVGQRLIAAAKSWAGSGPLLVGYFGAVASIVAAWSTAGEGVARLFGMPAGAARALACVPLALFVGLHAVPRAYQRWRSRRVITLPRSSTPDYFNTAPLTPETARDFGRADDQHRKAARWLADAPSGVLFLTGESGTGKTSLLVAYALPALRETKGWLCVVLGRRTDAAGELGDELAAEGALGRQPTSRDGLAMLREACAAAPNRRILVVVDQFEDLLTGGMPAGPRRRFLYDLVSGVARNPIPNLTLLLVFRKDYTPLVEDFAGGCLPRLGKDGNWHEVGPFLRSHAVEFLRGGVGGIPDVLLDEIFDQMADVEERSDLFRPVTLNIVGVMLVRKTVRGVASLVRARKAGGFLYGYLIASLREADVWGCARPVLRRMIDLRKRPTPVHEDDLARDTAQPERHVRSTLLYLSRSGLVRCLDDAEGLWEISHGFVARLLDASLRSWRQTTLQTARRSLLPLSLVCMAGLYVAGRHVPQPWYMRGNVNAQHAVGGETPLHQAVYRGDLEAATWLLDHGAAVDVRTFEHDRTPLMFAAANGDLPMVRALAARRASPQAGTRDGETPLHMAAWYGHRDVCAWLADQGVDVNAKRFDGQGRHFTPLHYAAIRGNLPLVALLVQRGARINECSECTDDDPVDGTGTALGYALEKGYLEIAQFLIDRGAVIGRASVKGYSPLHLAAALDDPTMIRFLLKCNADANAVDSNNRTPLEYAKYLGHQRAVDALLGSRIPPRRQNAP